jgi:hypothetical protein
MQTTSLLKKGSAIGIILLFLTMAVVPDVNTTVAKTSDGNNPFNESNIDPAKKNHLYDSTPARFFFITYNSYIIMTYDQGALENTTFLPGQAYSISIQVGYRVAVPTWLLHYHFRSLKNWFLFHSFIVPNMIINMSAESTQPWAEVYPVVPNIYTDIQNEFVMINSTVIVSLGTEAPQGSFVFSITALAPAIHRINGFVTTMNLPIEVQ